MNTQVILSLNDAGFKNCEKTNTYDHAIYQMIVKALQYIDDYGLSAWLENTGAGVTVKDIVLKLAK
jgi:hypothetical protein